MNCFISFSNRTYNLDLHMGAPGYWIASYGDKEYKASAPSVALYLLVQEMYSVVYEDETEQMEHLTTLAPQPPTQGAEWDFSCYYDGHETPDEPWVYDVTTQGARGMNRIGNYTTPEEMLQAMCGSFVVMSFQQGLL